MHAVFFEMRPKPGHLDRYFEHVARLRPVLARHEGLVFLDRYGSLSDSGLLLSHHLWRDDDAIAAWHRDPEHRRSQAAGRQEHFDDYRIRVGERKLQWHSSEPARLSWSELDSDLPHLMAVYGSRPVTAAGFSAFESYNNKGRFVSLADVGRIEEMETVFTSEIETPGIEETAVFSIQRDYGQFDRSQAPR